jgi:hypothetical protein
MVIYGCKKNLAAAIVSGRGLAVEAGQSGLIVRSEGRNLEVSNGLVLVKLVMRDGGYAQEFHAINAKGEHRLVLSSIHKDLIPSSEHRACASPMISGARQHLFAVCRESLRMLFSEAALRRPDDSHVVIELSGSAQGHAVVMRITVELGSNVIHVSSEDTAPSSNPVLEYLMSAYAFVPAGRTFGSGEEPEFTWAPNLRPSDDAVIGDIAFFSPAAIVQHGRYAAALMPDLDELRRNRSMPAALDLDLTNGLLFAPLLSYGFCDYEPAAGGRYFRHDITMSRRLDNNRLCYGFHLMVDADCKHNSAYKQVARFLWSKHGSSATSAKSSIINLKSEMVPDARGAYGLWAEGARTGQDRLIREAKAMRDAVLSAPQSGGLFPTRFDTRIGFWRGCASPVDTAHYSTAECSMQLYWLLRLHSDFEASPASLTYARRYADHLIDARLRSGAIPCWYAQDLTPVSALRSGAPTAASALFLAELTKLTGLKKHLQACESAARFVLKDIVPKGLFLDDTCMEASGTISLDCPDPHTGMRPQSTQAMLWVARMCLEMHSLCGAREYLDRGLDVLDLICLMQSVGEKPWMRGSEGLLARGNTSARPDPELSADFALCAMRYGAETGRVEYLERGTVALRAASGAAGDDLTRARIAATAAIARARFGSVYASVSGKWSVELDGYRVVRFDSRGAKTAIDLKPGDTDPGGGRVVFGGLRASLYEVAINGERRSYSREEMEAGVRIPAHSMSFRTQ